MEKVSIELQQLFEDNAPRLVNYSIRRHYQAIKFFDSYEDMHQTLLLKAWQALPAYDKEKGKFTTYICKVCYNAICKQIRIARSPRRAGQTISLEHELAEGFTLSDIIAEEYDAFEKLENEELLDKVIPMLSKESYAYYIDRMKQEDIARTVGLTQAYISRKIRKNISQIKSELEREV